ncbi:MAG: asparaginase domain-containing protein [Gammaproteobacteria bacterium]|jgi:L-asparaginase|nr:MAG: asparaginase [Gammaproteobacteria bacterium SG8_31]
MLITFITTGGTIDKVYFDAKSAYEVGETVIEHVLRQGEVGFDYRITPLMRKDSLDLTERDRLRIRQAVETVEGDRVVITHGTDTMVDTARSLAGLSGKVIVLTGSLSPARFQGSDADFNIGLAVAAVQSLPAGVYIAMNGLIFDAHKVRKNREANRFEYLSDPSN